MSCNGAFSRRKHPQGGYALLLVVFLTAVVLISTMSVGLRVLTEGRRQREEEMIWRGKQYTRGIKLYYRKFGRFPTSMDNLTKPQTGNIRFMRQAYTDPMNKEDGSWRLIYVGPAGQLIGSLKPPTSLQLPTAGGQPAAGTNPSSGFGAGPASGIGILSPGAPSGSTGVSSSAPAGTGASGTSASGATGTDSQNIPTGDTPTIVGGNIIGIGSKINRPSVIVYEKATNYRLFEFIWDPSKDLGLINSPGVGTGIGTPAGTSGQPPVGSQPGPGTANPPTPPPNPNPQP
jgi:hypothetical protein